MKKVTLRNQRISDAKKFFDILNNDKFIFFSSRPKSIKEEKEWLIKSSKNKKDNKEYHYAILFNNELVGGIGIKIDQRQKHIGEIGYFIDENYWGNGIAPKAVKLVEKTAFQKLKLKRIEIRMNPKNKASIRVAIKENYKKEGLLKKAINHNGKFVDCYLYAKVR